MTTKQFLNKIEKLEMPLVTIRFKNGKTKKGWIQEINCFEWQLDSLDENFHHEWIILKPSKISSIKQEEF